MSTPEPLPAAVSDELLSHAKTILKLDLSYLFASIAILTALNIQGADLASPALLRLAEQFSMLLTFDTVVFLANQHDWMARNGSQKWRIPGFLLSLAARLQPVFHLLFITGAIMYGLGYASGMYSSGTGR
jgi:hypothetical protein